MCYEMRHIVSLHRQTHIPGDLYIDRTTLLRLRKARSLMLAGLIKFLHLAIIPTTLRTIHIIRLCKQRSKMFRTPQTLAWTIPGGMGHGHQISLSLNIVRTLVPLPSA